MRKPKREYGEPKLINSERPMESTGNREAELLTTDNTDERGSGIGAETQKLGKADGKHRAQGSRNFDHGLH